MRVLMLPVPDAFRQNESGIRRVVEAYRHHGPDFGIDFVDLPPEQTDDYDLLAVHAGIYDKVHPPVPLVAICHGLYWTADYPAQPWERHANASVVASLRAAAAITVPSAWVGETIRRDMRRIPFVVPHGVDWQRWQHSYIPGDYVLWNKNRNVDVCSTEHLTRLALLRPRQRFLSTFPADQLLPNVEALGVRPHNEMKQLVQGAAVYLSTTKETFGIGVLEALAAGVPVLGFAYGGNLDLVRHGETGYLAVPGSYEDLAQGLDYCLTHRKTLSQNAREAARAWTWPRAVERLAEVFTRALQPRSGTVAVIIPCYNYATEEKLGRAIRSVLDQTDDHGAPFAGLTDVLVVDDGSEDAAEVRALVARYTERDARVRLIRQSNAGVAAARNRGISAVGSEFIVCLDADDWIKPQFLSATRAALLADPTLGVTYTGLEYVKPDGETGLSSWPGDYNYDRQLKKQNQIPTCCMFRREMWASLGGYKSRYCPNGAGSEDAEFWLRAGAYGWGAKKVTDAGLFVYSWMSGRVSGDPHYQEIDWTAWHPWTVDHKHPFASLASPAEKYSHPVRQYDQPQVSVVIPVGPGHERLVEIALDSLEAQTFRKWEAVLAWDAPGEPTPDFLTAYPYVRLAGQSQGAGAGAARNRGAAAARAPLLLFLDADDWLVPQALEKMVRAWQVSGQIVYTDYVGRATMSRADAEKLGTRLLAYDERRGEAIIRHQAADYDCTRAQAQPDLRRPYLWSLVSSLIPKTWHDEIGGFDEQMSSWEDWDYWLRLARTGKCFDHLAEPLVVYRFNTGARREAGLQDNQNLLQYLISKYQGVSVMPCGCHSRSSVPSASAPTSGLLESAGTMMSDSDVVLILYAHDNQGAHMVYGASTGTFYGRRHAGEQFYVNRRDQALQPDIFRVIQETPQSIPQPPPAPLAAARTADADTELAGVPGITVETAALLNAAGVHTLAELAALSGAQLARFKGIGPKRARAIREWLAQQPSPA